MQVQKNLPADSKKSYSLTQDEKLMLDLKYKSKRICDMSNEEISLWTDSLLLKINIITGWVNPSGDLLTILQDQFSKKLTEDYPQLNVDEIEHAFRKSGTSIEDWGKTMNLNLIDKVLIPYTEKRYDLSRVEEIKVKPQQVIYTDEQLLNIQRGDIEAFYQRLLIGRISPVPDYFYEVLDKDELLLTYEWDESIPLPGPDELTHKETVNEFFVRKINSGAKNIYIKSK